MAYLEKDSLLQRKDISMAMKPLLRLGQQVPVENSFELLSASQSGKLVKQLFRDSDNHVSYITFNAVVMAVASDVGILEPYMLEENHFNGAARAAVANKPPEEVKKP